MATNLLGATLSALVVLIAAITKLAHGAWVVMALVPLIVLACRRVHTHYEHARAALTPRSETGAQKRRTRVTPPRPAEARSGRRQPVIGHAYRQCRLLRAGASFCSWWKGAANQGATSAFADRPRRQTTLALPACSLLLRSSTLAEIGGVHVRLRA